MAAVAKSGVGGPRQKKRRGGGRYAWNHPKVERAASNLLARERRWRSCSRKSNRSIWMTICLGLTLLAIAIIANPLPESAPPAGYSGPHRALADKAESLFPLAIPALTDIRASEGKIEIDLTLPSHVLESPAASHDPFERLAAPFVGFEQSLAGREIDRRLALLAAEVSAPDVPRCYTYAVGGEETWMDAARNRMRVRPIRITLLPGC